MTWDKPHPPPHGGCCVRAQPSQRAQLEVPLGSLLPKAVGAVEC